MPLEERSQLTYPKSGLERFVLAQFCFQLACCNLCRLQRSRQRTCYYYVRLHLQTVKKLGYLSHLFLTEISEGTLIIRPGPVRPIGFAVSEKIELHRNEVKRLQTVT